MGRNGEKAVAKYLEKQGYKLIKRNYRTKCGEADLVCEYGGVIVFVEVKTRYGSEFGTPEEAVTPYKVARYVTAAKSYTTQKHLSGVNVRFDIVAIDDEGIRHIENAFCANDAKYPRN